MYHNFFGFKERPFSLTPDTQFFLNQQSHREALNTMLVALRHSEGFIKIVGEVGTGKTLLCRILLSRLGSGFVTAYIPNPYLTPEELKAFVAMEIGADYRNGMLAQELVTGIYHKLLQLAREGKQVVLVIDEAQAMPRETIECLRLLTNLETEKRKLLQVVMLGQPELDVLISRADLRQLKQRIVFAEYLKPLKYKNMATYVRHRVAAAGCTNTCLFSNGALRLLAFGSAGIPRLINILSHKALICAYGKGHQQVNAWHIAKAIMDTQESKTLGKFFAWHCRLGLPITAVTHSVAVCFGIAGLIEVGGML